jgi:hypothetical protein
VIEITRVEKRARLNLSVYIPFMGTRVYHLDWVCSTDEYAALLADRMRDELNDRVRAIRKKEYEQGWKDAKAHRVKKSWFSSSLIETD